MPSDRFASVLRHAKTSSTQLPLSSHVLANAFGVKYYGKCYLLIAEHEENISGLVIFLPSGYKIIVGKICKYYSFLYKNEF
jgi:hypothetical protein